MAKKKETDFINYAIRILRGDFDFFQDLRAKHKNVPTAFTELVNGYKKSLNSPAENNQANEKLIEDLRQEIKNLDTQLKFNSEGQKDILAENEALAAANSALTLENEELKNKQVTEPAQIQENKNNILVTESVLLAMEKVKPEMERRGYIRKDDIYLNRVADLSIRFLLEDQFNKFL